MFGLIVAHWAVLGIKGAVHSFSCHAVLIPADDVQDLILNLILFSFFIRPCAGTL